MSKGSVATIIYNPSAGMLQLKRSLKDVVVFWQKRGWTVHVEATLYAGHAETLARDAANKGQKMILAAGGDGTLGEIVNGLVYSDTILAPLPGGTGNSFAKELGLPIRKIFGRRDLIRACNALWEGRIHEVDVGRFDGNKYWLQWAGAGVDGDLIRRVEPRGAMIRRFGFLGYLIKAIPSLISFHGMQARVWVDDKVLSGNYMLATISNCRRFVGGMAELSPQASLDDGLVEVWLFEGNKTATLLKYIWLLLRGEHVKDQGITCVQGKQVRIETEQRIPVHRDGDPYGFTPINCRVNHRVLSLLVPNTVPDNLLIHPATADL